MPRSAVCAGLLACVLALVAAPVSAAARDRSLVSYRGLATWVDLYDASSWQAPEQTVATMAAHGVRTLFLETGNSRQKTDIARPAVAARFVDAAHAAGLRIVAWYLPTLVDPLRDRRRVLAALRFVTPSGESFDSFALDIEASDVQNVSVRNGRLAALAASLRAAAGPSYPLGAIVPSAVGMTFHPDYWPRFPYRMLARSFDVFLPMAYFTYRVSGRARSAGYVTRSIAMLRAAAGRVPVHVVGGIAGRAGTGDLRGFLDAVASCRPIGFSLYDFRLTDTAAWNILHTRGRAGSCS